MKIELLTSRAGADGAQNRGDVIDVPDAEAKRMIEAEQARPYRSGKKPENTASKAKPEKASK